MTPHVPIVFWTILSLGPIPIWHLLFHAFLPCWKRTPWAFYGAGAGLWGLFLPIALRLASGSSVLFVPPPAAKLLCLGVGLAMCLIALWSIRTLTPRRFFLWAALRPEQNPPERIRRGPYRVAAHPTYLAMIVTVASSFLASGEAVLLGAFGAIGSLLTVVMVLEQRELKARLDGTFVRPPAGPTAAPVPSGSGCTAAAPRS